MAASLLHCARRASVSKIRYVFRVCFFSSDTHPIPEPKIAAKHPFKVDLEAGKRYSWCACGHSMKQPFCDGTHKKQAPGLSPVRFTLDEAKTVWLCGCKRTQNATVLRWDPQE